MADHEFDLSLGDKKKHRSRRSNKHKEQDFDFDLSSEDDSQHDDPPTEPTGNDESDFDLSPDGDGDGDEEDPEDDELDPIVDDATDNPKKSGVLRTVDGAHLIKKFRSDTGTFTELWMYMTVDLKSDMVIRRAITADTDIPPGRVQSSDGNQTMSTWSCGNVEFVELQGLPD